MVFLNGEPIVWCDATQGPRMAMRALLKVELKPEAIDYLRKGQNVIAIKPLGGYADFGMYASREEPKLGYKPRPRDWSMKPQLLDVDLSETTPSRPKIKTVLPPCTTGLTFDPPGKTNDAIRDMHRAFLGIDSYEPDPNMTIEKRAQYFGHFDSRIRRAAAYSLMKEGKAAMPHIIDALKSDDIRVVRAGCDAIAGSFSMNGLGKGNFRKIMTPDIAGEAVPHLIPLLKHEDVYVREGALMALSNCGKAAAQHMDAITAAADDEDWWVRAGVSYVLRWVEEPETAQNIEVTVQNYLKETSIFGRNRLRMALTDMAKRGHGTQQIVEGLMLAAESRNAFHSSNALNALSQIGPYAMPALPL
ncbi:MAG: HEAT repeat domain-containing protein, partial [Rhodospirillales bacterium]|nr:HEAT repeat domain-containing protein [Rhodospirillales bacterium]